MMLFQTRFSMIVLIILSGVIARAQAPVGPEAPATTNPKPLALPVVYDDHRFFVVPVTGKGKTLSFLTSTGEESIIYSQGARELNVTIATSGDITAIQLPTMDPDHEIPAARGEDGFIRVVSERYRRPYMSAACWGILGHTWFAERVWTLDYPAQKMYLRPVGDLPTVDGKHAVDLAFRSELDGGRENNLPRLQVEIAGEHLDMALHTGASAVLNDGVVKQLDDKRPAARGMSFISQSQFDAWKAKNQWRVIERAEQGNSAAMIEVPKLTIGGFEVGPVWFMARPDAYFREQVSSKLDRRVTGALGGNALRFFRVTLDMPGSVALFERP